jgi:hypothetical protein
MRSCIPLLLCLMTHWAAAQHPRYAERPTAPPVFGPDNPEGLIFAGVRTEVRHAWKRPVMWRQTIHLPPPSNPSVPRMNASEQAEIVRTLDALVAVLKATPTGSRGEGFWVNDSRTLGFVDWLLTPPAGSWYWNPVDALDAAERLRAGLSPAQAAQPACWAEAGSAPRADGGRPADGRNEMRGDFVPPARPVAASWCRPTRRTSTSPCRARRRRS